MFHQKIETPLLFLIVAIFKQPQKAGFLTDGTRFTCCLEYTLFKVENII